MKNIYLKLIAFFGLLSNYIIWYAIVSKNAILPDNDTLSEVISDTSGGGSIDAILAFWKDTIFWILAVVATAAFVFIGAKLLMARWNPEEFKKAIMYLVYVIVWLVLITAAWLIVTLVSSLNLN